jgi:hypothetical protein
LSIPRISCGRRHRSDGRIIQVETVLSQRPPQIDLITRAAAFLASLAWLDGKRELPSVLHRVRVVEHDEDVACGSGGAELTKFGQPEVRGRGNDADVGEETPESAALCRAAAHHDQLRTLTLTSRNKHTQDAVERLRRGA